MTKTEHIQVTISCDASWQPRDNSSGWAAVIEDEIGTRTICGPGVRIGNNTTAELYAVIQALKSVTSPSRILLRVDSEAILSLQKNIECFAAKKFMRTKRSVLKNYELLKSFWALNRTHSIEIVHVKGHSGDRRNERADKIAALARRRSTHST